MMARTHRLIVAAATLMCATAEALQPATFALACEGTVSSAAPNPMTTARRISKIFPVAADEMLPICRPFFARFV